MADLDPLEKRKLELEIKDLGRPSYMRSTFWISVISAIVAIVSVYHQNVLSTIRKEQAELDAEKASRQTEYKRAELTRMEKALHAAEAKLVKANSEIGALGGEIGTLEQQRDVARTELANFRAELAVAKAAAPPSARGAITEVARSFDIALANIGGSAADANRIAGDIAWNRLKPGVRGRVYSLLGGETLSEVSNWFDGLRAREEYRWATPLHFMSVPMGTTEIVETLCPPGGCVVSGIRRFSTTLRDNREPAARREALKFLVGLVIDAHRPLHVSYLEDRGGNMLEVRYLGGETNLHSVWDSRLVPAAGGWQVVARRINGSISASEVREWGQTLDPLAWANETYLLTLDIYRSLPADRVLGQEYFKKNSPLVERQLAKAGVRLARLIEELVG